MSEPRCPCSQRAADRRSLAQHIVVAHGATVPSAQRLSRALLIADRIQDGLAADPADLWLFRLPGGVEGSEEARVTPAEAAPPARPVPTDAELDRTVDGLRDDLVQTIEQLADGAIAEANLFALPYEQAVEGFRRAYLLAALGRHGNVRVQTARAVGLSMKGLLYAIARLGIVAPSTGRGGRRRKATA